VRARRASMTLLVSDLDMFPVMPFAYLCPVAIITHKGAAADAGHYMGFVKKSVFYGYKNQDKPATSASGSEAQMTVKELDEIEDDEDWYKFDDDKVTVFPKEKLATLDGGGEDSSAYVLLYKSKIA